MVRLLSLVQFPDQLRDVIGFLIAHAGGRLVEQQKPRLERERHHDFGGALVAMRELADQAVGFLHEAAHFHQIGDAGANFAVGILRQPWAQAIAGGDLDRDAQIFAHRQLGKYFGDLERAGDAASRPGAPAADSICLHQSKTIFPEVCVRKPLMRLKKVVLPAPLGPMMARNSPGSTAIDTSSTATRLPKCFDDVLDTQQAHDVGLSLDEAEHAAREEQHNQHEEQADERHPVLGVARYVVLQHQKDRSADERAPETCACRRGPP